MVRLVDPPDDISDHGPYPRSWAMDAKELWASQVFTMRDEWLGTRDQWREAQNLFFDGWINREDMDPHYRNSIREAFYDYTGNTSNLVDWEVWREFMGYPSR